MGFHHGTLMVSVVLLLAPGVTAYQAASSPLLALKSLEDTPGLEGPVEQLAAGCGPVLYLERVWYGARITDERRQDQQFLAPVDAVDLLPANVLATVGLPGLPQPPREIVEGVADVALRLAWHENYLTWDTYVDHVTVALGAPENARYGSPLGDWRVAGVGFQCGLLAAQTTWERDPRASEVDVSCLSCATQPLDGWVLTDVLRVDARLAKAEDYSQLPPGCLSLDLQPQEVVQAAEERIASLQASLSELKAQFGLKATPLGMVA